MYQFLCLYNMIIYNELVKNTGTYMYMETRKSRNTVKNTSKLKYTKNAPGNILK